VQLKTKNGKCDVNCGYLSAQTGCYAGWEVGKDCPGDMTVNEPTVEVPVILTDDGPIIFEDKNSDNPEPFRLVTPYFAGQYTAFVGQYTEPPKKRGRKPNKN
jgi:hypothetical protein